MGRGQPIKENFISLILRQSRFGVTGFSPLIMAFGIERRNIPHYDTDRDEFSRRLSHLSPFFNIGTGTIFLGALEGVFLMGEKSETGGVHYEVMNLNPARLMAAPMK